MASEINEEDLDENINAYGKFGETRLHTACRNGQFERVKHLVELGADVNILSQIREYTPLYYSLFNGFLNISAFLISKGADVNKNIGKCKKHLIFEIIDSGYNSLKSIKLLLDHGADINSKDPFGKTILMKAILSKREKMIDLLLLYNLDLNLRDNLGNTALMHSIISNSNLDNSILKKLISLGADLNIPNLYGDTPLISSLKYFHESDAAFLLPHTKNINHQNFDGKTALHCAVKYSSSTTVKSILSHYPDLSITTNSGHTALDIACQSSRYNYNYLDLKKTVELLLRKMWDIPKQHTSKPHPKRARRC